ncbi:MAG TPA: hypothetical protein PKE03_04470 [Bacteroidales bacterium]|nr:hypothetical protein [Bacteroidales bacterium]
MIFGKKPEWHILASKAWRLFLLFFAVIMVSSCLKEDPISTDPSLRLEFSNDTVIFDTVFTSLGSITRTLMVYNNSNKRVRIANISLGRGGSSPFRMNVDGIPGLNVHDIEIAARDSIFVFVKATIDPRNESNPFVEEDDLIFNLNGNEQQVKLVAWGQDAHYILADQQVAGFPKFRIVADSNQTVIWTAGKPYVIYGYALIDSYGTLIIEEGTRVHFHDKSGLWAYVDGVLKVRGSRENPVIFQGDRLDLDYRHIPGQWDRIWLMEGRQGFNHEIDYAIIRNGFIGLQVESFLRPTQNQLTLTNTIIENHTGIGIFTRLFAVEATNLVVANCGNYGVALTGGGAYRFRHTTLANNWTLGVRNTPSLFFTNFLPDSLNRPFPIPLNMEWGNSIIYGSAEEEIGKELVAGADSTYIFDHCLLRTKRPTTNQTNYINIIRNQDPKFKDYPKFDYRLDTLSPAIGKGKIAIGQAIPFDIAGNSRLPVPDLGAYQFVPSEGNRRKETFINRFHR